MKTAGRLTIKTKDGKSYTELVSKTLGNPLNPMTDDVFAAKFYSCMDRAACPKTRDEHTEIMEHVKALENINDIRDLANML